MREKLRAMDTEAMSYSTISLNSFSDAPSVQTILEQPLEKKSGAPLRRACLAVQHAQCTSIGHADISDATV